jgi:hypothetical protein
MVKPGDFENYVAVGKTLATYWLRHSKAPETSREPRENQTPKPASDKTQS